MLSALTVTLIIELVVYVVLVGLDINTFTRSLKVHGEITVEPHMFTSLGGVLTRALGIVRYERDALEWQLRAESLRKMERGDIPPFCTGQEREGSEDREGLYSRVLKFVSKEFRGVASAIVVEREPGSLSVFSKAATGARFEAALTGLVEGRLYRNEIFEEGLIDCSRTLGAGHDLSLLGIRFSILYSFRDFSKGGRRAALWIGYRASQAPTDLELHSAKELTKKLEQHLLAYGEIISLSKRVHEAENANEEKSEFIAHMSHDIRSPLNNIQAVLGYFLEETKSTDHRDLLQSASRNCGFLAEMVEDLLDYSKHRAGRLFSHKERFEIGTLLNEVKESFRVALSQKGLSISCENNSGPAWIEGDRKQIRRVLSNLVSNAVKYTEYGTLELVTHKEVNGVVRIEIRDTGCGISTENLARLFTPFSRFHTKVDGIGLGLVVTKILTELNSGTLHVVSELGRGTLVTLNFPEAAKREIHGGIGEAILRNEVRSILLVDDDIECVRSVERVLARHNFKVTIATSVRDALSLCNFSPPDFLITDGKMPEGGAERILRFVKKGGFRSRIAVISGQSLDELTSIRELGAEKIFLKPAPLQELLEWLQADGLTESLGKVA